MKDIYILSIIAILHLANSSFVNTTEFWKNALSMDINFQTYAGYEEIDWYRPQGTSGMHYHLFGAVNNSPYKKDNPNIPLMIWFQGKPGNSSLSGAFNSIGPFRIVNNKAVLANYSWNSLAHQLFIDQPLNVGFSYSGNRTGKTQVKNSEEASLHLINFLYNFYKNWPSLKASPLYIAGQLFAGHYATSLAHRILTNITFQTIINAKLQGLVIGNAWVDPVHQMNYYDSWLYSAGIVSEKIQDVCSWYQDQATANIVSQNYINATFFWNSLTNDNAFRQTYLGGMHFSNIRVYEDNQDLSYLNFLEANKLNFGVPAQINFISGNLQIYESFQQDISMSYSAELTILLRKVKVLVYQGQDEYTVTTGGVLNYLNQLSWSGIQNWKKKTKQIWKVNGQVLGWIKKYDNLQFVLVNGGGEMIASDKPFAAYSMIQTFIRNSNEEKLMAVID